MVHRIDFSFRIRQLGTEGEEVGLNIRCVVGKVFAAHLRVSQIDTARNDLFRCLAADFVCFFVVDVDFGNIDQFNLGFASVSTGNTLGNPVQGIQQGSVDFTGEGPDCTFHAVFTRNDVEAARRVDITDSNNHRIHRTVFSGDHVLQRHDDGRTGYGSITAMVRVGTMRGHAGDLDLEPEGGSVHRTWAGFDMAEFNLGRDMGAEHVVYTFQAAAGDHGLGALTSFFGRLEDKLDGTGKFILMIMEALDGAHQHRIVGVVTAGVHAAGDFTGEFKACFFLNRQGIDVTAQQDSLARTLAAFYFGQNTGRFHPAVGDAHLVKFFADTVGCPEFLHGEFRMAVNVTTVSDDKIVYFISSFSSIHFYISSI